jgi:hypothetical protein
MRLKKMRIAVIMLNYGARRRLRLDELVGIDNRPAMYSQKKADNRLCVCGRIKTIMFDGGCISGKKFFLFVILFLSGHNNPRVDFRFRITGKIKPIGLSTYR